MSRVSRPRLLLFALGDFAFNLFWQSAMLFLLFYYTEALDIPIGIAATTYMIASVWDGLANFAVGLWVDRRGHALRYGPLLVAGAVPLGLLFMLAYAPPVGEGPWVAIGIFVAHLLFRTAYAAVNVPYLAMSARISADPSDRAFVAGTRMLFGTGAAVTVALATIPLGQALAVDSLPGVYFSAALVFGIAGALILVLVGLTYRDGTQAHRPLPPSLKALFASLARNRAFVTLNAATMAMIIAVTLLNKSVLYYFKYLLDDPKAGEQALAAMGLVSALAIPLWMAIGSWIGLRSLWFLVAGLAIAQLAAFAVLGVDGPAMMQIFLIAMQVAIVGLHFIFWAMLPNTIEYGEQQTGLHVEGAVFGVAALLQRIAIGIATAILGWSFASAGFVANVRQSPETLTAMRLTVALVPMAFLALSCAAMAMNPLGRRPAAGKAVA